MPSPSTSRTRPSRSSRPTSARRPRSCSGRCATSTRCTSPHRARRTRSQPGRRRPRSAVTSRRSARTGRYWRTTCVRTRTDASRDTPGNGTGCARVGTRWNRRQFDYDQQNGALYGPLSRSPTPGSPTMRPRSGITVLIATVITALLAACSSSSGASSGGSDLQAVRSAGVLRVGTEGTYSPFSFHDPRTNQLTGYDVEVAKAVADKLGVKVQYVETPWDAIFAGLGSKRFDLVVNQVTKNPERAGLYGLSSTYTWSEGVIATR